MSFRFATSPDVERCSGGWSRRGVRDSEDTRRSRTAFHGPAEVRLDLRDGEIRELDTEIVREGSEPSGRWRSLGTVSPQLAADYLLDLAETADEDVGEDALGAATLADGVETWPRMLEIARNRSLAEDIRSGATFWRARRQPTRRWKGSGASWTIPKAKSGKPRSSRCRRIRAKPPSRC